MPTQENKQTDQQARKPEQEQGRRKAPKTVSAWEDLVSQRIEEATNQGAFENLRGKGKPQDLRKSPLVPEGKELAFDLLKNNDLAPAWVMDRQEVQMLVADFRERLNADVAYYRDAANAHEKDATETFMPESRLAMWQAKVTEINKQIDTLNLNQPIAHLEILKLRLGDELKRR